MTFSKLPLLALIAALAAPLPVLAQETAPAETPAETPAEPAPAEGGTVVADPSTGDGLSMGVEVGSGAAQVGDTYIAANFETWEQRCIKTESGIDPCQLYQLLKDGQGNNVAELSIFSLPEGTPGQAVAGANLIAPLETLLTEGLRLTIDGSTERGYPFTFCTQIGCISRLGFTAEELAMFKKGNSATMTIVPFVAPDQKVALSVSLKGFTAGYDAMAAANKLADEAARAAGQTPPTP